jgi:hypothetical protein
MWVGEILKCDPGWLRMKNYVIGFESRHTTYGRKEIKTWYSRILERLVLE